MKVNIIKGPLFEQRKEQAQEYLYQVISNKVNRYLGINDPLKKDTYTLSESDITISGFSVYGATGEVPLQ